LSTESDRNRVRTAIALYLFVFVALNIFVWGWFVAHRHGPHHFPLGERVERFGDLLRFSGKYQFGKDPRMYDPEHLIGTLFPANYPPFAVMIYLFLLQVCAPYALPVMLMTVLGAITLACTFLWRRVRRCRSYRWYVGVAIFATGLLGWGTEQIVMRANIEGVMWIAVCIGAALYARRKYSGAGVAFGIASCIKPYPVLWLVFMVKQHKYRAAALGVLSAAAVTMASLLAIDPNPVRAYRHISAKSNFFHDYILGFRPMEEMKGDHSLLQSLKTIARIIHNRGFHFSRAEYLGYYNDPLGWKLYIAALSLAVLIGLVTLWRVWNKPVLNQMFALACITTVLPMVTADYTLSVLLVPMGFFLLFLLEDAAEGKAPISLGQALWFLIPCAWIMGTEPLITLHGVLKCIAVLVLLVASTTISLPSSVFGEITRSSERA
jgi:hypothetical protein